MIVLFAPLRWKIFVLFVGALMGIQNELPRPSATLSVHIFLNTECPISQQYLPQLARLHQQFKPAGVQFMGYFPLRTDSTSVVQRFSRDYAIPFVCTPDTHAQVARRFRVRVTPEVVVTDPYGRVRYQGAIDNWYVDLGQHRKVATEHYLQNALDALLAKRLVHPVRTEAVGCLVE